MHPALADLIAGYPADLRPGQRGHGGSTRDKQSPGTPQAAVLGGLAFDGPGSNPSISHPALPLAVTAIKRPLAWTDSFGSLFYLQPPSGCSQHLGFGTYFTELHEPSPAVM